MKLITLNTHSLVEPDYGAKTRKFAQVILKEQPDIVALQEVNQSQNASVIPDVMLPGYVRCSGFDRQIRSDNHALILAEILRGMDCYYYWTWISAKTGYGKYDEGMALLTRKPVVRVRQHLISRTDDYENWKTRKMLGVQIDGCEDWFFTVHMGWWNDEEEPFKGQWDCMENLFRDYRKEDSAIWLMGDFNSPDNVRDQGYDLVTGSGWKDSWEAAAEKDEGFTVEKEIDGWRDSDTGKAEQKTDRMRLDYIFSSEKREIFTSEVICNGKKYPIVSDHCGVMITVK